MARMFSSEVAFLKSGCRVCLQFCPQFLLYRHGARMHLVGQREYSHMKGGLVVNRSKEIGKKNCDDARSVPCSLPITSDESGHSEAVRRTGPENCIKSKSSQISLRRPS